MIKILHIKYGKEIFLIYSIAKDHSKCCKDKGVSSGCLDLCKSPSFQQKYRHMDFRPSQCDEFKDKIDECRGPESGPGNNVYCPMNTSCFK